MKVQSTSKTVYEAFNFSLKLLSVLSKQLAFNPVVLKRESLGSLREKFLNPGRKFVPEWNWGGKAVDEKKLLILIYSTHIKTTQQG